MFAISLCLSETPITSRELALAVAKKELDQDREGRRREVMRSFERCGEGRRFDVG
jgi:hypothetical protein